ncbi:MAG: chromosomal replication initiator protein DnaA [Gemmatimonadetes bacterium]|nr:chromosomal replication initiator protein DnaA [Gemmatimonadota bacterium]
MSLTASDVWSRLLERARLDLTPEAFESWLAPAQPLGIAGEALAVGVPDQFAAEWNERNYQDLLESYGPVALGHPVKVTFQADPERVARAQMDLFVAPANRPPQSPAPGGALPTPRTGVTGRPQNDSFGFAPLSPRYTLNEFVVGRSNELAAAAALAVSQQPGRAYNPYFIYGDTGLGKTHLMQAIGHGVLERNPDARVAYVGIEQFTNEFIQAVQGKAMSSFKRRYRELDVLLVDDVQFLKGKESTQEEFFHTFNTLYEAGRQIVLTSDRPPVEIPRLEARLVSRFQSGMVADVGQPDYEHRLAILQQKLKRDHLEDSFPGDVLELIAERVQSNVRELEGCIIKLLAFASLKHKDVTVELALDALRDRLSADGGSGGGGGQLSIATVQKVVAQEWQVTPEALMSKSRLKAYTVPRQVAMYLVRTLMGTPLIQIGEAFGGRDHSTVIHSLERVEVQLRTDPEFATRVQRVENRLLQQ